MSQLLCKNISIAYEKENVVDNLSIAIEQGDYVSIIGENGTGKSSLLKGILGLVSLKNGKVEFGDGLDRKNVGYLSQQNPMQKDFPASVYEVVLSGCLKSKGFRPFFSKKERRLAVANLKKMGMEGYKKSCYADLSGGQKQRVLLARALCATDKMIILDEPVTGLDPVATADMYHLVNKLNKDLGITIVMVTHDIDNALKYSNKILHLHKNNKYYFGPKDDYLIHGGCTDECCAPDVSELPRTLLDEEKITADELKYGPADSECKNPTCQCHHHSLNTKTGGEQ
ncbi:MAG: ATP-binding cassette domain-containing protein [Lachnospiraceae bacterium]|nr:ATP-binding cassette domain-containing protein [Lachnospiraceae bacterium]